MGQETHRMGPPRCLGWLLGFGLLFFSGMGVAAPSQDEDLRLGSPSQSLSLGYTNKGKLLHGKAIKRKGPGYELLPQVLKRKTHYGTEELIGLLERALKQVESSYPGSVLALGNMGYEHGGKIGWSASHQGGRDVDLGMFGLLDGQYFESKKKDILPFVTFDEGLQASHMGDKIQFDLKRNLALVSALIEDQEVLVQYIFVANWLKDALLQEALKEGYDEEARFRLSQVLHQPTDGNPHAHHFHVRIYCPFESRYYGCHDRPPMRPWMDFQEEKWQAYLGKLSKAFREHAKEEPALALKILARLGDIRAYSELETVGEALSHKNEALREKALSILSEWKEPKGMVFLLEALKKSPSLAWSRQLMAAFVLPEDKGILGTMLDEPASFLPEGGASLREDFLVKTMALLTEAEPSYAAYVPRLWAHRKNAKGKLKKASEDALSSLLCQRFHLVKLRRYWQEHQGLQPHEHALEGLQKWGLVKKSLVKNKKRLVPRLISLLAHQKKDVRQCAYRVLKELTGHVVDPKLRSPRGNARHWRYFWAHCEDQCLRDESSQEGKGQSEPEKAR